MQLRLATAVAVFASAFLSNAIAVAAPFSADFSKPGSTLAGWTFSDTSFSVLAGSLSATPPDENKIYATWTAVPVSKTLTVSGEVTAGATNSQNWKIAGLGIIVDADNYWHVALVESPDADGKKHFTEISQMHNGNWGATDADYAKLTITTQVGVFEWKTGVPYLLTMTLTPGQLQASISDAGVVKFQQTVKLTDATVNAGQPMLDAGGIKATFAKVHASN